MSFHFFNRFNTRTSVTGKDAGFSLVELLVSISIVTIVASIILVGQSSFNGAVLLRGQAYEIALQIREVQLNAVGVSFDGSADFRTVLGVHFSSLDGEDGVFQIFRDANSNGFPDAGETFGEQGILDPRFEIREIRILGAAPGPVDTMGVMFVRPNFDAQFVSPAGTLLTTVPVVEIDVSRRGETGSGVNVVRTIEVTSTGQIAVQ